MSYRAFKKLLGESTLERKTRFWLAFGIIILMISSFWLFVWQTERVAFEQVTTTGRLLVDPIVARVHLESADSAAAMKDFQEGWEQTWPEGMSNYRYDLLRPNSRKPENRPTGEEQKIIREFMQDPGKHEVVRMAQSKEIVRYYAPVRASASCLKCHPRSEEREETGPLKAGDVMDVIRIELSTEHMQSGLHTSRAFLVTNAIVTALLIVAGSYLIIRYVVVKPVKHLRQVSEAISNGQLDVRSDIHTGDEFEELSYAFNRMVRNLMSMQERLQVVNTDLDKKVDELAQANMALYESNRLKSDFLTTMSHELRTPLHSILGFSDVLLTNPQLSDKQQRWVVNIQASGKQLLALIEDVLDLAKMEAGKMKITPESFALAELTEPLLNNLRPLAEKKNIELRQQLPDNLPRLHQDAGKVRQILSNFLSNAIKFTPEGGRVLLRADAEGDQIVLKVIDTGVGIAPEDQERIFEKFRQVVTPHTREYEGTGLGLSIVRELSKLLGGDVSLHSELGRGSTFTVRLPLHLSEEPR
ncbi:MAG TPA: ATP-binding protein, partial [Gemmataceae bacterium]|nr:ATP-binding protein [Gemmataceae bacterium]